MLALPFVRDKTYGEDIDIIGVEPTACPTLTKGPFMYDFGDPAATTPLLAMHTLGHDFIPAPIHAGGLRYHGVAPIISQLLIDGLIRAKSYNQLDAYKAGVIFVRTEEFIPAPETNHAIKMTIDEAFKAKEEGREKVIVFNFSGHGHFDLSGYDRYFSGKLEDYELTVDELEKNINRLWDHPKPLLK